MPRPSVSPEAEINPDCAIETEARRNYLDHGCAGNCDERAPGNYYWVCTRDEGHEGPHVAANESNRIRWPWRSPAAVTVRETPAARPRIAAVIPAGWPNPIPEGQPGAVARDCRLPLVWANARPVGACPQTGLCRAGPCPYWRG